MRLFSYYNRLMAATALLSISLIACQVAMMQLLSIMQWYHYANMVISVALLGFGAAGTFLSLARKQLLAHSETLLPLLMMLSGLTMIGAVWISRSGLARFDSFLLFVNRSQWISLLVNYLLFFLPFFFGALALGIIFVKYAREIGKFYFSNLIGSGIGALIAASLAWYFLPAALPPVTALLATLSGSILLPRRNKAFLIALALAGTMLASYRIINPVDLSLSQYKSLSRTLQLPNARIRMQKPSPYGLVQVVSADALRYAPGLSLAFTGKVPVQKAVFNNGDWYGTVDSWRPANSTHLLDYTTMALPYVLKKRDKVLVLHSGTGMHVAHALSKGATAIDAVESHSGITDLLMNGLAWDNDSLFYQPAVHLHVMEPRRFLSASQKNYDLIVLPVIGAFGGTSGLYAMQEEYSLTKQAFLQMWNRLNKDGVICITTWMDYPFRNPLKIAATLAETAHAAGINLSSHLAALRSWGTVSFLLKKAPLTAADTSRLRAFAHQYFFDPVFLPGLRREERTIYNGMSDTTFFSYIDELLSVNREKLYHEYDFSLRPATDNKPYFSQFIRWKSLPHLQSIFGSQIVPFLELGWLVSAVTFIQVAVLAILLIVLPLFRIGWRGGNKLGTLLYFSGLGMGYMLLEIVLIQQFILFFGNPVYTASFIIGSLLISSGIGSYFSSRWMPTPAVIRPILLLIAILLLIYAFFLSPLLQYIIEFPLFGRLLASLVLIVPLAFIMGMPFPLGIRALSGRDEKSLPWAWGVNGCVSVISAALATLLAVETGFKTVMLLAALAYAISILSFYRWK